MASQVAKTGRYLTSDDGLSQDVLEGDFWGIASGVWYGKRDRQGANPFTPFTVE